MSKIITCNDGTQFKRCSRWIAIRTDYDITPRHSLYELAEECEGGEKCVSYIQHNGITIPTSQMILLGSMACPGEKPFEFKEKGETHAISTVDFWTDLYNPYYIEFDEWGEKVRLYEKL